MNIWIWSAIWVVILAGTVFLYAQILSTLKAKADRLNGQLAILEKHLAQFETDSNVAQNFKAEKSAIEEGEFAVGLKFAQVQQARRKAKAQRERRLISRLKNESRKL